MLTKLNKSRGLQESSTVIFISQSAQSFYRFRSNAGPAVIRQQLLANQLNLGQLRSNMSSNYKI